MMEANESTFFTEDEYLKKIREEKEELYKAKNNFKTKGVNIIKSLLWMPAQTI